MQVPKKLVVIADADLPTQASAISRTPAMGATVGSLMVNASANQLGAMQIVKLRQNAAVPIQVAYVAANTAPITPKRACLVAASPAGFAPFVSCFVIRASVGEGCVGPELLIRHDIGHCVTDH